MREYKIEELIGMVLKEIKNMAEKYYGEECQNIVITVPVHFDDFQRSVMKKGCENAGFRVLRILKDSTACGLAYQLDKLNTEREFFTLMMDMGMTLKLSVLGIEDGIF